MKNGFHDVFAKRTMGPGESYYANLVESIDANCTYSYTADQEAKLKVVYRIVAVVEDPEVWVKEFPLVAETVIEGEGKEISFSRQFSFGLDDYENFVEGVNSQLGVVSREPRVTVETRINVIAETEDGQVREELTPSMIIPLAMGEFQISGSMTPQENGSLKKAALIPNPGLRSRKINACLVSGALFLLCTAFALLTKAREPKIANSADLLWERYGERMVKAGDDFVVPDDLIQIPLYSMDHLIKVADESGKPIIYHNACSTINASVCYVIDGLTVYKHLIKLSELPNQEALSVRCCQVEQKKFRSC
jgi:hypothetical protein